MDRGNMLKASVFSAMMACALSAVQALAAGDAVGDAAASDQGAGHRVTIHIIFGSTIMAATMNDTPTAREFVAQLPRTLTLRDLGSTEKVSDALPKRLSEEGASVTDAGALGDIAYYAPWGNIAFYRGPGPNAQGVIKIAHITSGLEALDQPGALTVTVARAE